MVVNTNPLLSEMFYALGYTTALVAFVLMARRRHLYTPGVLGLIPVALISGLAGGTLVQYIFASKEGKSILGAIIFGYLAIYLYKKRIGLTRPLGDLFAVSLAAGEAVGRFGCLFAGCCYGKTTSTAAFTIFQHGATRYPTQIYLSVASLLILVVLLVLEKRQSLPENGLFCVYGILYCIARFTIEFYRFSAPSLGFLTIVQIVCMGGLAFYALYFTRLIRLNAAAVS